MKTPNRHRTERKWTFNWVSFLLPEIQSSQKGSAWGGATVKPDVQSVQRRDAHTPNRGWPFSKRTHAQTDVQSSHQSSGTGHHPQVRDRKREIQQSGQRDDADNDDDEYRRNIEEPQQQQAGRTGEKWWATLTLGASQHQGSKTWKQGVKIRRSLDDFCINRINHTGTHLL